jgi:hypothetical protein
VYKLDSFVGFIGDEQVHALECYEVLSEHQIFFDVQLHSVSQILKCNRNKMLGFATCKGKRKFLRDQTFLR